MNPYNKGWIRKNVKRILSGIVSDPYRYSLNPESAKNLNPDPDPVPDPDPSYFLPLSEFFYYFIMNGVKVTKK